MTSSEAATRAEWPRAFHIAPSSSSSSGRPKFWTHQLYRGPNGRPVQILYSRTKMESEELAHHFIGESVVGFDMEWPFQPKPKDGSHVPLQKRIGLIQIAKEDMIGLFHIGLHVGQTPKDVLAPTLREIIESEDITKTGVGILNADFSRLRRWFDVKPRGALELSHFHNLVTFGNKDPRRVTTRMKSLTNQVEAHLGLPLFKGKVRTSNWSRPLNKDQIQYAAADAYAGIMLYHCMNAKRLSMNPVPPLPIHAEKYLPMRQGLGSLIPVRLGPSSKAVNSISALEFYQEASTRDAPDQPSRGNLASLMDAQEAAIVEDGDDMEGEAELQDVAEDSLLADCQAELDPDEDIPSAFELDEMEKDQQDKLAMTDYEAALVPDENVPSVFELDVKEKDQQDLLAMEETEMEMAYVAVGRIGRQLLLEPRKPGVLYKSLEPRRPEPPRQKTHQFEVSPKPKTASVSNQKDKPTPEASKGLFAQLSAHRKRVASEEGCPPFVVAHNTLLTAISDKRPRNDAELRSIHGVGKVKAELYGPAWLAIVNDFVGNQAPADQTAEQSLAPQTPTPATPVSRRTHAARATDLGSNGHGSTPPILHTGLSFSMANATMEAKREVVVISDDSDDEASAFGSPMRSPSPSTLKRKRQGLGSPATHRQKQRPVLPQPRLQSRRPVNVQAASRPSVQTHSPTEARATENAVALGSEAKHSPPKGPQPGSGPPIQRLKRVLVPQITLGQQASLEAQILRNKLRAFNNRIRSDVVLPDATIESIVRKPPATPQELLRIPGIAPFANACARRNQCLFSFVAKATQKSVISEC